MTISALIGLLFQREDILICQKVVNATEKNKVPGGGGSVKGHVVEGVDGSFEQSG